MGLMINKYLTGGKEMIMGNRSKKANTDNDGFFQLLNDTISSPRVIKISAKKSSFDYTYKRTYQNNVANTSVKQHDKSR